MSKRALVTGSSGFVGRHFVNHLRRRDWEVWPIDTADGLDARDVFRHHSMITYPIDLVVHAAAVVGGRKVIDGSPLDQAVNLELDAGLFRWALRAEPARILYFSSSAVYPTHYQNGLVSPLLTEDMVKPDLFGIGVGIPDQLYGWAKLTGENLAHRYREAGGLVSVVRPFSGYGADQDASYPFPAFIDRALRREDPFTIWGDGTQTRDFIHIDDIIRACMVMVEERIPGPVNLGTGVPTTMLDLARRITDIAGYDPGPNFMPAEPRGVRYRVADTRKLSTFYKPAITLEEGIERALVNRRMI